MLRKVTVIAAALALLGGPVLAAGHPVEPKDVHWDFEGPLGKFKQGELQRGFKVYVEVCSQCHSMNLVTYRMLAEKGGPFWDPKYPNPSNNPRAKALAADKQFPDIDPDTGDVMKRPGTVADHMPAPFPNEAAARASNGGALPPDMSVLAKAREGGAPYIYSIVTGYNLVPVGMKLDKLAMPAGKHFNRYMAGDVSSFWKGDHAAMPPGALIAMPPPLTPNKVSFDDGTKSTVEQQAMDVAAFLEWASDPKATERKQTGLFVMVYLIILAGLAYLSYRRVWRNESH